MIVHKTASLGPTTFVRCEYCGEPATSHITDQELIDEKMTETVTMTCYDCMCRLSPFSKTARLDILRNQLNGIKAVLVNAGSGQAMWIETLERRLRFIDKVPDQPEQTQTAVATKPTYKKIKIKKR